MSPHPISRRSTPGSSRQYRYLTPEQIATWMHYGFVKVSGAFSRAAAARFTQDLWIRLGFDPDDPRTWVDEVIHMQSHNAVKVSDFSPKAWGAICDLVGGADRIEGGDDGVWWDDSFIVNLGSTETEGKEGNVVDEVNGWHVDGDFFVHFLDSPEQGLLVVPLWADVIENGGGTVICCDGIGKVAKWLVSKSSPSIMQGLTKRRIGGLTRMKRSSSILKGFQRASPRCTGKDKSVGTARNLFSSATNSLS